MFSAVLRTYPAPEVEKTCPMTKPEGHGKKVCIKQIKVVEEGWSSKQKVGIALPVSF